ncbi:MAG: hypothetical protein ACK4YP_14755 [Myxococcota bacterium]
MAITLFQDRDCKGRSLDITRNYASLKDTALGNHPSSIRMTDPDDAILLCKKEDWNGGVLYLRGKNTLSDLGEPDEGGENTFRNSVTSVRVTPFTVALNVTVVKRENGDLPGSHDSHASVESTFGKALVLANDFFAREKALLRLEIARITFRTDDEHFDLTDKESDTFPSAWKNPGELDFIIVNTIEGAVGRAKFPWHGKVAVMALGGEGKDRSIPKLARTLAHEVGHYYGLTHDSGDNVPANIMTQSDVGLPIDEAHIRVDQIEELQQKLARNITRQKDREE